MSLFKKLFTTDKLKNTIVAINSNIEEIISHHCSEKFNVMWYGAYDIDPKHLVYWICIQTDEEKKRLQDDVRLNQKLRFLLEQYQYPLAAQTFVHIGFESQETVDRESKGNWWHHFK